MIDPELEAMRQRHRRRVRAVAWIAIIALAATTAPVLLVRFLGGDDETSRERWETLATTRELAAEQIIFDERRNIFLVDDARGPIALFGVSPHSPLRAEQILFCPSSGLFEAEAHGETFDGLGRLVAGPAERGMDRFDLRVRGDEIQVNTAVLYFGSEPDPARADDPKGPACGDQALEPGPPGFWGAPGSSLDRTA